jgi:hypothetical protein
MALTGAAVTVATTPTPLHTGSVSIYVGGSDVTTTAGIVVAAGRSLSLDLGPGDVAFACCAASTVNARVVVRKS